VAQRLSLTHRGTRSPGAYCRNSESPCPHEGAGSPGGFPSLTEPPRPSRRSIEGGADLLGGGGVDDDFIRRD
jgi:hypothetical protein